MASTRLPGKVLKPIMGRPMLALQIERLRRSETLDKLIIATSIGSEDDAIEALCEDIGIECSRGSLEDVLDRFYHCAQTHMPENVVRLTGDCPLADPGIIDRVVRFHLEGGYDYTSNVLPPTWPDGMDVEVMRFACLIEAHSGAKLPSEREHATSFIYKHPERFRLGSVTQEEDQSLIRLTVDESKDFELVSRIYERLYPHNPEFGLNDIMNLLAALPEILAMNQNFTRNEGLQRSEQEDMEYLDADE